ncbi:MAG: hypothetical protein ACRCUT_14350, partial [Spirochaetota bacterium]
VGIVFIVGTVISIYFLGRVLYSKRAGLIAGTLYGCIISSYHTGFLATNGEVIYNLFFVLSFIFYYCAVFRKKYLYFIPLAVCLYAGYAVKFQGIYAFGILAAYTVLIHPVDFFSARRRRAVYYGSVFGLIALAGIAFFIDWNITGIALDDYSKGKLLSKYHYVANKGFSPAVLLSKLALRIYQFGLYHSIIWVPGIIGIVRYFRSPARSSKDRYIVWLSIMLCASVFIGGVRLYTHYFIPVLATLSITSSVEILRMLNFAKNRKRLFLAFVLPVLFWFGWNMRDLAMHEWKPEWKHNEGAGMFLFRSVFINDLGEYLLPHKTLQPVIGYLKNETPADSSVIVWPMGTEVVYFSERRSVVSSYWFNEKALYALVKREKGDSSLIHDVESDMIDRIQSYQPDYFVDVSDTAMIRKTMIYRKKSDPPYYFDINSIPIVRYGSYGSLTDFPAIITFLNAEYVFAGKFGEARVWKKAK